MDKADVTSNMQSSMLYTSTKGMTGVKTVPTKHKTYTKQIISTQQWLTVGYEQFARNMDAQLDTKRGNFECVVWNHSSKADTKRGGF